MSIRERARVVAFHLHKSNKILLQDRGFFRENYELVKKELEKIKKKESIQN